MPCSAKSSHASRAGFTQALELSLGAVKDQKGCVNFGAKSSDSTESWQILSVNRNVPGGSMYLNRGLKDRLRSERLRRAVDSNNVPRYRDWMRFTKPRGPEQIVYGDKVICVRNHRRSPYLYVTKTNGDKEFVANGEISLVTGQMQYGTRTPFYTNIEFAGRSDRNFSFRRSDFSEDGQPYVELAYVITVRKAQGSEFGSVILVLPAHSRLISQEMLYTALTRQKKRIWILHQGPVRPLSRPPCSAQPDGLSRSRREISTPELRTVHFSTEADRSSKAKDHLAGQRDIESTFGATPWLGDMNHPASSIDIAWFDFLQGSRSAAGQQRDQVKLTSDWIVDRGQFDKSSP